jgi:hypothetical protein
MHKRKVLGLLGGTWAAAILLAAPLMAAAPTGFLTADVGAPDTPGEVTDNGNGTWTVVGSGSDYNGQTEDQFFYVYKAVKGDGSVTVNLLEQSGPNNQYVGPMIRSTTDANAPFAGAIMATGAVNWLYRIHADDAAVRVNGPSSSFKFPRLMRVQRVGNAIQGFLSDDGKIWEPLQPPVTVDLGESALFGFSLSSRSSDPNTAEIDAVKVEEGVVSVSGIESAATNNVAFLAWQPINSPNLTGYNVYRGDKGATLDKMALLSTVPAGPDPFYVDNSASNTPLRNLSYVVAPVFKGADGKAVDGPAVRVR